MPDQTPKPWTPLHVLRSAFYLGEPHTPNGLLKRIEAMGYTIVPTEAALPAPLDEPLDPMEYQALDGLRPADPLIPLLHEVYQRGLDPEEAAPFLRAALAALEDSDDK